MPGIPRSRTAAILQELCDGGVDFIVVGGVAAVLEGVPVNTFDLDVVHSRTRENIGRLLGALDSLKAIYRTRPELAFRPLDILGMIGRSRSYDDLLPTHTKSKWPRRCACGS